MINEMEARSLLQQLKIERGIEEHRSCAEIVQALALVTIQPEIHPLSVEDKI